MLIGNYSVFNKCTGKFNSFSSISDTRANYNKPSTMRNIYFGAFEDQYGIPFNYLAPYNWVMAYKLFLSPSGSSTITGVGTVTANITALLPLSTIISGATIFGATGITISSGISTIQQMQATLTTYSELSPENMAHFVWNSLATLYTSANTMGGVLNGISTGSPLDQLVESGTTLKEALRLLLAIGVGKTTVTSLGGGQATVTFRDINDTTNRVIAHMTNSDRSAVTYIKT